MNGGYILIDLTKYTTAELLAGVEIPGISDKLKRTKKPVVVSIVPSSTVEVTIALANISFNKAGDISAWALMFTGDALKFSIDDDMLSIVSE